MRNFVVDRFGVPDDFQRFEKAMVCPGRICISRGDLDGGYTGDVNLI